MNDDHHGTDHRPIRLIVLFGGESAEHDISCTTAAHVLTAIDRDRYDIDAIGITRDGRFVDAASSAALLEGSSTTGEVEPLKPVGDAWELTAAVSDRPADQPIVVLPLLHGPRGEDGTIQGLCELANLAYVGAGVLGSSVTMDKAMAKTVLDAHGIPQARWRSLSRHAFELDAEMELTNIVDDLGLPVFIKPANMGSSVGVSKAATATELRSAVDRAMGYDEMVVIEEAVAAREIEIAVLGNDTLEISVPGEIIPGAEFYDYEDKYFDGGAELVIPASLPDGVGDQLRTMAADTYRALRVDGMARADFFFEEDGRGLLVNELNTIPGFTPTSMYPKLWEATGLGYADLIDRLVDLALDRHRRRSAKRNTAIG